MDDNGTLAGKLRTSLLAAHYAVVHATLVRVGSNRVDGRNGQLIGLRVRRLVCPTSFDDAERYHQLLLWKWDEAVYRARIATPRHPYTEGHVASAAGVHLYQRPSGRPDTGVRPPIQDYCWILCFSYCCFAQYIDQLAATVVPPNKCSICGEMMVQVAQFGPSPWENSRLDRFQN